MESRSRRLIGRAVLWTVMGGACAALFGAMCGFFVGFVLTFNPHGALPKYSVDVCSLAVAAGFLVGGISGALTFFRLNWRCAPECGLFQPSLFLVFLGMEIGIWISVASIYLVALLIFIWSRKNFRTVLETIGLVQACLLCPASLVLGQIWGSVYTEFMLEKQNNPKVDEWGEHLIRNYDPSHANHPR